ncbi:pectinesterase 3 [Phtheirospermum japonicum]|uniref:Pectinesterase n=1 Tax=Phtheirospermum japonicum TaxID=374723 RepID=A0A830C2W8_9LAMI|nr:pectinesterase 3 [Phtheirospermum japonicum]
MDTVQSFKGYGKVDELEEAAFRKKTRKRIIILSISLVLLLAVIVGVVAGVLAHKRNSGDSPAAPTSPAAAIKAVCSVTQYPESCLAALASSNLSDPEKIFQFSLTVAMGALEKVSNFPEEYANKTADPLVKEALLVCGEVVNDAVDYLNDTVSALGADGEELVSAPMINDLKTWLSAALTHQDTCLDALAEANATFAGEIELLMKNSTEFASNSLAIVAKLLGLLGDFKIPIHRRLMAAAAEEDRRMLQGKGAAVKADVVVAKDGSGTVTTINEAVAMVKKKNKERFVIHVKAGVYKENVVLEKHHWNVMIIGDGKTNTIITGSKNFVDGVPTFSTATFAVAGKGFVARGIKFMNTAGAAKHQAVALRSGSDLSVFQQCSFDAYQDTLYAHSNRQFYRDCDITGTIDFIFGNSAVVFQNCNINPRQPLANQFNTITAQGRKDLNQNTGISIQRCVISPLGSVTAATYLGRPWKEYSTTIIMQSNIGGFVHPQGWIPWVQNVDPPKSIFYAEYQNKGAGASTSKRVSWAGYKRTLTTAQAAKFTVESFIQGSTWLPATNVIYESN